MARSTFSSFRCYIGGTPPAPSLRDHGLLAVARHLGNPWHSTLTPGRRAIMGAPPDIVAFHVGIVVRDLHAVMDRYQRLFALEHWHLREPQPGLPMRIAYGGRPGPGLAFEPNEPVPGAPSPGSEFLQRHGAGVQHIGLWTPDLLGSLQA